MKGFRVCCQAGSCPGLGVRQAPESAVLWSGRCPVIFTGAGKLEVPRGPFRRKQQFLPLGTSRQSQQLSSGSGIRAGKTSPWLCSACLFLTHHARISSTSRGLWGTRVTLAKHTEALGSLDRTQEPCGPKGHHRSPAPRTNVIFSFPSA